MEALSLLAKFNHFMLQPEMIQGLVAKGFTNHLIQASKGSSTLKICQLLNSSSLVYFVIVQILFKKKNAYTIHCKVCTCMYTIVFSSGVFLEFMTPPSLVDLLCSKPELALPNYRLLQPVLRNLDEAHLETLAQVFDPSRNPLKGHLCRFMGSRHR